MKRLALGLIIFLSCCGAQGYTLTVTNTTAYEARAVVRYVMCTPDELHVPARQSVSLQNLGERDECQVDQVAAFVAHQERIPAQADDTRPGFNLRCFDKSTEWHEGWPVLPTGCFLERSEEVEAVPSQKGQYLNFRIQEDNPDVFSVQRQ